MAQQMTQAQLITYNKAVRKQVLSQGQEMFQPLASGTIVPINTPIITIPWRNVGLVRGFWVEVTATFTNSGGSVASRTPWNAANLLSNITLVDFDNYTRINTTGKHCYLLNTIKEQFPYGAALVATAMDTPIAFGNAANAVACPATLTANGGTGTVRCLWFVPCAYSKDDLRGAIFAGVTNANAYLSLTPNPLMGSGSGDGGMAVFQGAGSTVACTSFNYTVYQAYIDDLPRYAAGSPQAGAPILPPLDISTQYRLGWTSNTGLTVGQDFPIVFSNFQDFLSLFVEYDQNGVYNPGTDINYFAVTAANTLQLFKRSAFTQMARQRIAYMVDLPPGDYLFDFRDAPISTNQTGNMQLTINPSSAAAGSNVLAGFESFGMVNTVLGAASLPAS